MQNLLYPGRVEAGVTSLSNYLPSTIRKKISIPFGSKQYLIWSYLSFKRYPDFSNNYGVFFFQLENSFLSDEKKKEKIPQFLREVLMGLTNKGSCRLFMGKLQILFVNKSMSCVPYVSLYCKVNK